MPSNVMTIWPPEHDSDAPTAAEISTKLIDIAKQSMKKRPRKLPLPLPATDSLEDIAGALLISFRILDDEYFESRLGKRLQFNFTRYATHHQAGRVHGYFESPMLKFGQHALDFRKLPEGPANDRGGNLSRTVDPSLPQGLGIHVPTIEQPGPAEQATIPSSQIESVGDEGEDDAERSNEEVGNEEVGNDEVSKEDVSNEEVADEGESKPAANSDEIGNEEANEEANESPVRPSNIPKGQYETAGLTIIELGPKNHLRCTAAADDLWFSLPYEPAAYDQFCAEMNRGHTAYTNSLPVRVQMRRYNAILIHECIHAYFALHTCNCNLPQCRPFRSQGSQLGKTGHGALFIDTLHVLGATLSVRQKWERETGEHIGTPGYDPIEVWQFLISPLVDLESECKASNWFPDATQLERWGLDFKTIERHLRGDNSVCVVS